MKRNETRSIKVGSIQIGGNDQVIIQSMTNTKTSDVTATIAQINELTKAGCQIVRVAVLNESDARAIAKIKAGISIPLVADIHFDYKLALIAIESGVDKVRINPGNIGSQDKVAAVVAKCKEFQIPIRIGVNSGSIEREILQKYGGPTPEGMVESAQKHIDMLEKLDFHDYCVSLKSSNTLLTIKAYELASQTFTCPLHVGVTEAGTAFGGTIKSAIGIGTLLYQGIGNTIRVSLSDNPVEEIKVAKAILKELQLIEGVPTLISCPTCGRTQIDLIPIAKEIEDFISGLESNLTIAIMGCAVNGPGEAREADIGIAGGVNEGLLFKKGKIIRKIPQQDLVGELKKEIMAMIEAQK